MRKFCILHTLHHVNQEKELHNKIDKTAPKKQPSLTKM